MPLDLLTKASAREQTFIPRPSYQGIHGEQMLEDKAEASGRFRGQGICGHMRGSATLTLPLRMLCCDSEH